MPKHCCIYVFNSSYELNQFSFFDISGDKPYFKQKTSSFFKSPLYQSLSSDPGIKVTCYFSGTYLTSLKDQEELNAISSFVDKGQIELLLGTYHNSFSCLFSSAFYNEEIVKHRETLQSMFGMTPQGFLNTAAIFSNDLLTSIKSEKVAYVIAPRVAWYLGAQPSSRILKSKDGKLSLVLVGESNDDEEVIVSYLPGYVSRHWDLQTLTTSETIAAFQTEKKYNLPSPIGLDTEGRDLTYFLGNSLQKQVFKQINRLSSKVEDSKDEEMKKELMVLASPAIFDLISQEYTIRYDYYSSLMNCLTDMELKLDA